MRSKDQLHLFVCGTYEDETGGKRKQVTDLNVYMARNRQEQGMFRFSFF